MTVQILFALGLLIGTALAVWQRCPLLTRSAIVLACNWVACQIAVIATGKIDPAIAFAVIDAVSAVALLMHPAGRTQAVIGAVYVMQFGLHVAQWPGGVAAVQYVSVLTVGGSLQIAFLIMGAIDGDGRKVGSFVRRRGRYGGAVAHGGARVEKGQGE